ncbi:hypothetical protein LWC34_12880 [Kibdelosporangium philippinense]|uniref:Three-Cys-motif partner protein n=1 Tax=Kibdelosporangium philippinense TaxID=211113 RepID=A0ABS8Z753_9PSEU|nr:hypothetical protein [Kibdelosporangium philippinense]MCE7003713.1 hypothetical protein [Kibdelosporangium philippinense]
MPESGRRPDPHLTVKREVLVRYLDAWTPAVLRSHRGATFVESGASVFVADAFRVFSEFADRLDGQRLNVVIVGSAAELGQAPEGISVWSVADPESLAVTGPALAYLDAVDDNALTEQGVWQLVASLARDKAREVLLTLPSSERVMDHRNVLRDAGLSYVVTVELVADRGRDQLMVFATGDSKHLVNFKNELWAADEFAGIRYRDPLDAEHTSIDISLTPRLHPLRTALVAELARRGSCTVAELQRHTLLETIYRPADAIGALTMEVSAGGITREPEKGRLTPRTVVGCREGPR